MTIPQMLTSLAFPTANRGAGFRPRHLVAALAVALAAAPALRAQEPADRAELERFRDSIAATADSSGLLALEKRLIDQAKADRSNAMTHLRLGFLSLRLGDLGGQSHYEDAASEFQWAIDLQPTWPYGWYGMGFAEYGVGDSQISFVTGIKTMLGKDALTRSAMAFAKSAEVDPGLRPRPRRPRQHRPAPAGQHQARRRPGGAAPGRLDGGVHPSRGIAGPRPGRARGRATATRRSPPFRDTWTRETIGVWGCWRCREPCSFWDGSTGSPPTSRAPPR